MKNEFIVRSSIEGQEKLDALREKFQPAIERRQENAIQEAAEPISTVNSAAYRQLERAISLRMANDSMAARVRRALNKVSDAVKALSELELHLVDSQKSQEIQAQVYSARKNVERLLTETDTTFSKLLRLEPVTA